MAQAGCVLFLLVVAAVILAPMVGGVATGFVIALILMVVVFVAGYVYLKGDTRRQIQRVLARIDAYNPRWQFDGARQSSYGARVTFSWSASTRVETEDGSLSAELSESSTALAGSTHREIHVQVRLGGTPLFVETFLGIVMNEYAIAYVNARIAAIAGDGASDPLTRCRAHLADEAAKRLRASEIRRKYTGT